MGEVSGHFDEGAVGEDDVRGDIFAIGELFALGTEAGK